MERIPDADLPDLAGELARAQAIVALRLQQQDGGMSQRRDSPEPDRLLTVKEVMEALGVKNPRWVQRHCKDMGGFKVGNLIRVPASGLEAYKKRCRRQTLS
jgi:hypothetical protein